jgi:hypothetical protein
MVGHHGGFKTLLADPGLTDAWTHLGASELCRGYKGGRM